ncbi:C-GCAxxG-C-C family (seleno)protein [Thermovibrio sp.]
MERRKFLKKGFLLGVGVAAGAITGALPSFASGPKDVELPLPYARLNPQEVADRAYSEYFKHECCDGVFRTIISILKEKVGGPYLGIPSLMFWYGGGGIAGWGTVCGTLNAAAAIFNLTCKDFKPMIDTLFKWYEETPLPTYKPCVCSKVDIPNFPKSVSLSPLCHVSVQRWCKVASIVLKRPIFYNSKERSERCARLTASVAAKTVELLNAYHFEGFRPTPVKGSQKTKMDCRVCHESVMKELSE